jgi:hypothetical protein
MLMFRRGFATGRVCGIKRLPSFAEIESVQLKEYLSEEKSQTDRNLNMLREGETEKHAEKRPSAGLIKSFLYGSNKTQQEQREMEQSFSKVLMRGKYVHEMVVHKVHPHKATDYLDVVSEMYPRLANADENQVHLVGSWRQVVGDMDTYVHIWEYNGYPGFHHTQNMIHRDIKYLEYLEKLRSCVRSRESNIMQEFSFWGGTAAPRKLGGIFELRSYDLKPGKLLEWEQHWRKGLECRKQVMEPVGAWFYQLGQLNRVCHLWQFADLEHRKLSREKCWELPGWAETTHETVKLVNNMESNILVPLPFSPLK